MCRRFLFDNDFEFFKIYFYIVSFYYYFEKFRLCDVKFAFIYIDLNVCLSQTLKNLSDVLCVIFFCYFILWYCLNMLLQNHLNSLSRYHLWNFKKWINYWSIWITLSNICNFIFRFERCQIFILFWMHANFVECMTNIDLDHSFDFEKSCDDFSN